MAHDLDAIARTLRDAIGLAPDDWNPTERAMALSPATVEKVKGQQSLPAPAARRAIRIAAGLSQPELARELNVSTATISRWEAGLVTPRSEAAIAYAVVLAELRALASFGGDRAIRHVAGRGFVWPSAGLALCDEVDRLRVQNERLTLLATDRGEQLKKCAGKLAEQRTLISEVALEREQALAEAHRLRGEWEDAIANNEGVWEEGFHKGREYQREAERRG